MTMAFNYILVQRYCKPLAEYKTHKHTYCTICVFAFYDNNIVFIEI